MNGQGKVALVTGGGTGIGRAIALALAREGVSVAVNYAHSRDDAEAAAAEIAALGVNAVALAADVADAGAVRAMVAAAVARLGGLDLLVNSAGWTQFVEARDLEALTDEIWDRTLAVNLKGAFHCVQAATPEMLKRGGGAILNVSSTAGIIGQGSSIAYCASKAALICMTKSLARALAPAVRVNCIAPGVVETRWLAGQDAYKRAARAKTPLRRIATPEDVAAAALPLLLTTEFVTGQTLAIDGGLTY